MLIDLALNDHSANVARRILSRGIERITSLLNIVSGSSDFTYVACPDFSITLRQRRLILGFPIGGYVNWSKHDFYPLELDLNSCGVHLLRLGEDFDELQFRKRLHEMKLVLDKGGLQLDGTTLKWNFTRRNHFINVYKDSDSCYYCVFHSSAETRLLDSKYMSSEFSVRYATIDGRDIPYIVGDDVHRYWSIAREENSFFFERHKCVFKYLFGDDYDLMFADQHFGMVNKCEILMGCSRIRPGSVFPILTRPFEKIYLAKANEPPAEISKITGGYSLVPHGLGMTLPDDIVDIVPDTFASDHVVVCNRNGSKMVTDVLEYVGIGYRSSDSLQYMQSKANFNLVEELFPVLCLKL